MIEYLHRCKAFLIRLWRAIRRPPAGGDIMERILRGVGPVDTEGVVKKLRVARLARQAGASNLPEADAQEWDPGHRRIQNYFSGIATKLRDRVREFLTGFLNSWRVSAQQLQAYDPDFLKELGEKADTDTDAIVQDEQDTLRRLRKKELEFLRQLRLFKAENELYRRAEYPDSSLLHWGILFSIIVTEAALNSQFFAKGSEMGLLGGAIMAFIISLMNVGLSVLAGYFPLRWLWHIQWGWKVAGALVILMYLAAVLFFNMVVGHYRALLELDPDLAGVQALQAAWNHGVNFGDFNAFVLFMIGLCAAMLALLKVLIGDDKYPGFGRAQRLYEHAETEYDETKADINQRIREIVQTSINAIDRQVQGFGSTLRHLSDQLTGVESLLGEYDRIDKQLDKSCMEVVQVFRTENRAVRTSPPPHYFSESIAPERSEGGLPRDDVRQAVQERARLQGAFQRFSETADRTKNDLGRMLQRQQDRLNNSIAELEKTVDREHQRDRKEEQSVRDEIRSNQLAPRET